ncbi:MAG: SpaA isopeptide-forming pilin-related protein [Oscillospiraceae bacterium]|nr:SpaA isopeptide-forming pilin-related protein [Oscillospiraceae bacterium]
MVGNNAYYSALWMTEDSNDGFDIYGYFNGNNHIYWDQTNGFKISNSHDVSIKIYAREPAQYNFTVDVNNDNYGTVTCNNLITGRDKKNTADIVATANEGCYFVGWRLGDNILSGYEATIRAGELQFTEDNQVLTAVFAKNYTSPATQEINEWVDSLLENPLESNKTAHVYDYDNRIYEIDLSASSSRYTIDQDIRIEFITDISRSMYFPETLLNEQDFRINGQINLGQWLLNNGDPEEVYYVIGDINNTATMYAVYFSGNNYFTRWSIVDASYYLPYDNASTSGRIKTVCEVSNGRTTINMTDRFDGNANRIFTGKIYTSTPKPPKDTADWDRLSYLTAAVNAVSRAIYRLDPGAQIGLVTFASSASGGTLYGADDEDDFISALHNIQPIGGTNQTSALNLINNSNPPIFTTNSGKRQVALLITDGAPQGTTWDAIERAAATTEDKDVEIWTLGLALDRVGNNKQRLMNLSSDGGYSGNAEDPDQLVTETKKILQKMLVKASTIGEVYDTVDPAFYPVDAFGNPIEVGFYYADIEGGSITKHTTAPSDAQKPYYQWVNNNGTWTITYYNQEIKWPDNGGWSSSFFIKAKEDFMGGNTIQTNTGFDNMVEVNRVKHSGSSTGYYWLKDDHSSFRIDFGRPYVNVDELSLTENSTEWRVYLGTEVDPKTELLRLWDKIQVNQVVKNNGVDDELITINNANQMFYSDAKDNDIAAPDGASNETLPLSHFVNSEILEGLIRQLENEEVTSSASLIYRYFPYGHDIIGTFDITLTKEVNVDAAEDHAPENHTTKEVGEECEVYTLTVTYNPVNDNASESYEKTTTGKSAGKIADGYDADTGNLIQSENTHKIHVYAKTIEVEKLHPTGEDTTGTLTVPAKFGIYRQWKESDGEENKKSLAGYKLGTTTLTDSEYYFLVEEQTTVEGFAKYAVGLSAADGPYYLAETAFPAGYVQNKVLKTITVTPGPDTKKDLDGQTTTDMPYNWTQGVRFYFDDSNTPAIFVDGQGNQIVPISGTGARDYVISSDEGYFKTSVLNTPLGYLRVHKTVTYNGQTPSTAVQRNVLKGTYTFKVYTDQNCTSPVMDGDSELTLTVVIGDDGAAQYSNTVSLPVGTYWVKEIIDDDSYVLPVGTNPQEIEIKAENTSTAQKTVEVTNDYEFNEEDDNIAVDIVKQFTGLSSDGQIPAGYKAVLSYTYNGYRYAVDLGNSSYVTASDNTTTPRSPGGVQVKVNQSEDGLTWTWHVYNIPKDSSGFAIHEENYDKTGYDLEVYIDGSKVTDPEADTALNITAPVAVLNEITDTGRITPESTLRSFFVGNDYILVVSIVPNSNGVVIISERSLNYLEREALENVIENWNGQGPFCGPVRFFSTEQHNATINVGKNRDIFVKTDAQGRTIIELPPKTNNQVLAFDVTYDGLPAYNNCEIENRYTETGIDLDIVKVDATDMETPLGNAQFTLKKLDPDGRGTYLPDIDAVTSPDTDADGKTTITGITSGYYEISETKTPGGYIIVDEGKFYIWVNDGVIKRIIPTENDPETTEIDESIVKNWTVAEDNTDGTLRFSSARAAVQDNPETLDVNEAKEATNAVFTVGNTPGAALPNTGGPGTTALYLLGIMLTGLAGAGLVMRRKKKAA